MGDQSAGKSSLLQSLTDIPFPVADRLCTRFPTRIVSRRTPNQAPTTRISIEPNTFDWTGPSLSGDQLANRAKRLEAYNKFEHTSSHVSSESFKDVVEKVGSASRIFVQYIDIELLIGERTHGYQANDVY